MIAWNCCEVLDEWRWRMLETKCVGDKFEMMVTDSGFWWPIWYIEKITNTTKKVANIMILPSTSQISHHHKVTNITMSPITVTVDGNSKMLLGVSASLVTNIHYLFTLSLEKCHQHQKSPIARSYKRHRHRRDLKWWLQWNFDWYEFLDEYLQACEGLI